MTRVQALLLAAGSGFYYAMQRGTSLRESGKGGLLAAALFAGAARNVLAPAIRQLLRPRLRILCRASLLPRWACCCSVRLSPAASHAAAAPADFAGGAGPGLWSRTRPVVEAGAAGLWQLADCGKSRKITSGGVRDPALSRVPRNPTSCRADRETACKAPGGTRQEAAQRAPRTLTVSSPHPPRTHPGSSPYAHRA